MTVALALQLHVKLRVWPNGGGFGCPGLCLSPAAFTASCRAHCPRCQRSSPHQTLTCLLEKPQVSVGSVSLLFRGSLIQSPRYTWSNWAEVSFHKKRLLGTHCDFRVTGHKMTDLCHFRPIFDFLIISLKAKKGLFV